MEYRTLIDRWSRRLLLNRNWLINLVIECPSGMPEAYGACNWGYLPNRQYRIRLRCDLRDEHEKNWVIAHELLEALLGDYGAFCDELTNSVRPKSIRPLLAEQHGQVRDAFIEHLLSVMIPEHRFVRLGEAS